VLAEDSLGQDLLETGSAFSFHVDLSGASTLTTHASSAGEIMSESPFHLLRDKMSMRSTTTDTVVIMHCPKASSECTDDSDWSEVTCGAGCKITGTNTFELSTRKFGTYTLKDLATESKSPESSSSPSPLPEDSFFHSPLSNASCVPHVLKSTLCSGPSAYFIAQLSPLLCPPGHTFAPSGLSPSGECPHIEPLPAEIVPQVCKMGPMPPSCSESSKVIGNTPGLCEEDHYSGILGFDDSNCPTVRMLLDLDGSEPRRLWISPCVFGVVDGVGCSAQSSFFIKELSSTFCPDGQFFAPFGVSGSCPDIDLLDHSFSCQEIPDISLCSEASQKVGGVPLLCPAGQYFSPAGFDESYCPIVPEVEAPNFCVPGVMNHPSTCQPQAAYFMNNISSYLCTSSETFAPFGVSDGCPNNITEISPENCLSLPIPDVCSGLSLALASIPDLCSFGKYAGPLGFDIHGCPNTPPPLIRTPIGTELVMSYLSVNQVDGVIRVSAYWKGMSSILLLEAMRDNGVVSMDSLSKARIKV
jgi:hypothetical protein